MTGIKRIFLALLVLICSLFLIAAILIKTVFPSNILKHYIRRKIFSFTSASAVIRNVSISLKGITLSDVKLFYKDNSEISIEKLVISPNIFPFPRKQVAINEIRIINPGVGIGPAYAGDIFKLRKKIPAAGYAAIVSRIIITGGVIDLPGGSLSVEKVRIDNIGMDVKNASASGVFPVKIFFNIFGVNADIESECDFKAGKLIIKEAIIKSGGESVFLTGSLEKFWDFENMSFNINVEGRAALVNKVFLSTLYKKKITVFEKKNIKLNIYGTPSAVHVEN